MAAVASNHQRAEHPVLVVGLGARTPLGHDLLASSAAVRAGIAAFREHPYLVDRRDRPVVFSPAPFLADDLDTGQRMLQLAASAAREAVLGLEGRGVPKVPVLLGLPPARPGLSTDVAERIVPPLCEALREVCGVTTFDTLPCGHAAGLIALEAGFARIRNGDADLVLFGGVDSYVDPETLEWLEACDQLRSAADNVYGFVPGEAAAFCLLASPRAAQRYRLVGWTEVLAVATAHETNQIKTPTVCVGDGLTQAFRGAFASAACAEIKVDQTICDMNGETYRADEFGFTLLRTTEHFTAPGTFSTPADCWGDVGAASGPSHLGLAAVGARRGYAKGPVTLVWASSERGERCAALIRNA